MSTSADFIEIIPPTPLAACDEILRPRDATCLLFATFGAVREWSDFLNDCRRDKGNTNFFGLQLRPFQYEGKNRPLYRMTDVQDFIMQARAAGAGEPTFRVMYHDPIMRGIVREPTAKADPITEVRPLH